jgi:3-mercaptopyruvate sulfurtransferase SseA
LRVWLNSAGQDETVVLDVSPSIEYRKGHISGAWFASKVQLRAALDRTSFAKCLVLTSSDGVSSYFAWSEAKALTQLPIFVLEGGNEAWGNNGFPLETTNLRYATKPIDRYQRPYEGIAASPSAMQAYLDWEHGLVEQLDRDGTHGFQVIRF